MSWASAIPRAADIETAITDVDHNREFGLPGFPHMPTMDRLAASGISYNAFHTTAMCSPTRAGLLTGRNHHRVGAGQIAELAPNWDGYVGKIPKSMATFAQLLSYYGYNTAAFGKLSSILPKSNVERLFCTKGGLK